jgi:hypothetical protein
MRRILLALLAAAPAFAQGPDPAELAAMQRRAADISVSTREREQAADKAIEDRRALIQAAHDDEPRLTGWLIDQAAAVLARLGRDGADSAAIFGIPLAAQRGAAQEAAREAASDLDRADRLIEHASAALAAQGVAPEDPRLAEAEQDRSVRVPFYRSRAEVILAGLSRGQERARLAQGAQAAISKVALASAGPEGARRICLAAALLMRRAPTEDGDARTALDELAWVIRADVPATTKAEAWMGMAYAGLAAGRMDTTLQSLRLAGGQEPFTHEGRPEPLLVVLLADATTRALWERGLQEDSDELLSRAAATQTALLARDDLGLRPETLRPIVLEKLAIVGAGTERADRVPAAVRLGLAIVLAREPTRHDEAVARFRALADAPGAGDFAADALWEWAVLLTQSTRTSPADRVQAARVLTRLARDFPDHPRASDAINAAVAHARAAAVGPDAIPAARAAYLEGLAVATDSFPKLAEIDQWRYERARLLSERPAGDDLARARTLLEAISPSAAIAPEAGRLLERTHSAILEADFAAIAEKRRQGDEAAARALATDEALPAARRAADWARRVAPEVLAPYRLDLAEAMVDAGVGGAAPIFQQLAPDEASLPGGPTRVRLGLARALLRDGDSAGAFAQLRDLATRLDAAPPGMESVRRPDAFWHAWTLMLETLQAQDASGAKRGTIRANIKRLEGIDAALGGEPWATRIGRIRDAIGP